MKLTQEEVRHIADLARLKLTPEEVEKYSNELSVILDYIGMLKEVDTEDVEPTSQVTGLKDVTREDVAQDSSGELRQRLIGTFPESVEDLLKVKGVFNNEE